MVVQGHVRELVRLQRIETKKPRAVGRLVVCVFMRMVTEVDETFAPFKYPSSSHTVHCVR